jgi:hypothetical protein
MASLKEIKLTAEEFIPTLRETTFPCIAGNARSAADAVVSLFSRASRVGRELELPRTIVGAAILLGRSVSDRLYPPETWGENQSPVGVGSPPEINELAFTVPLTRLESLFGPEPRDEFGVTAPAYPDADSARMVGRLPSDQFRATNTNTFFGDR